MTLASLELSHALTVREWRNADRRAWRTPDFISEERQMDFFDSLRQPGSPHRYYALKQQDELFGMGGLTYIEWENARAELSLVLKPGHETAETWLTAVRLLLDEAFGTLGLETVDGERYLCADTEGLRACIEHYSGYTAQLRNRKRWGGVLYDSLYFAFERERYYAARHNVDWQ
jgi:hypothetical protein